MSDDIYTEVQYEFLDLPLQKIVDEAKSVRKNAYCPYSNFPVGAALLCEDGMTIISGCNVENLSFGLTNCAERSAIFQAVSRGVRNFPSIAICAEMKDQYVGPCGACRQVLCEFNIDMDVYLCRPSGEIVKTNLAKLLPMSFNTKWVTFSKE